MYLPISVLFNVRLYTHCVSNNLLNKNKYGFQFDRNTEHASLKFTGDVIDWFD